ncbi:MAG: hypothetical protein ACO2PM_15485 [Pyrobaculum sp.]
MVSTVSVGIAASLPAEEGGVERPHRRLRLVEEGRRRDSVGQSTAGLG